MVNIDTHEDHRIVLNYEPKIKVAELDKIPPSTSAINKSTNQSSTRLDTSTNFLNSKKSWADIVSCGYASNCKIPIL